jgi:putative transposase
MSMLIKRGVSFFHVERKVTVERRLSEEEFKHWIRREKRKRALERFIFIRCLYDGEPVEKAAKRLGRCKTTGYIWLERWNTHGPDGLAPEPREGRQPKLPRERRPELMETLRERDDWTTREVRTLLKDRFGVEYSLRSVYRILRGLGLRYGKPYPSDHRRPGDAEEMLKGEVEKAVEGDKDVILGFLDECSPQRDSNTCRVWSLDKPRTMKNTTKYRANTFGFYAPAGRSLVSFKEDSRKGSVCEFLEEVKEVNPGGVILVVLDNFPSHGAAERRIRAEELGMRLAYLPPHLPDLSPIEQIWRGVKRAVSVAFFGAMDGFLSVIREAYGGLSASMSYAAGWIQRFMPEELKQLCL